MPGVRHVGNRVVMQPRLRLVKHIQLKRALLSYVPAWLFNFDSGTIRVKAHGLNRESM